MSVLGLSSKANQLIIPVSFSVAAVREHSLNPTVLMDSAHRAEGVWAIDKYSSWLSDTKTRTWNVSVRNMYK